VSQLVTALLLLLAFPRLQAAAVFQLMDRVPAPASSCRRAGVGGVAAAGRDAAATRCCGRPVLVLAHPRSTVLILPAMGIVAEVITVHARRRCGVTA